VNAQLHRRYTQDWPANIARFAQTLAPLREKVSPFLNFHTYSELPRILDENVDEW
jgi:hypothetical protein